MISILLWPTCMKAGEQKPETNVNERYTVESIVYSGIEESKISQPLRDEAQKMVGVKYNEKTANSILKKLQKELSKGPDKYWVYLKVQKGNTPDKVKVVFQLKKRLGNSVGIDFSNPYYHSQEGVGVDLALNINELTYHNAFGFNLVSNSDSLLERYTGFKASYENQRVGTEKVHLRVEFDSYHEKFNAATKAALALRPDVPGVYRARQNFAPTLSLYPTKSLSLSTGLSFQRLEYQFPASHTETAYAGVADVTYSPQLKSLGEYKQTFKIDYNLRTATRILDSDFVYTRHFITAEYSLSNDANHFGADFSYGLITGTPPLFERFALGNTETLRGWNKFDVSPLGGTRAIHGSLEYRYRHFRVFYDVGTEWDKSRFSPIRHGLGFGVWGWPNKFVFVSVAFPVRLHKVEPVFGYF